MDLPELLNGIDLFSGYGGITLALSPWVRPIVYCEIERYPGSILLSRMSDGGIPRAPIWDDVRTFDGNPWRGKADIITGGFPCQDISVAGSGAGLEGKRSGLFFEILRLADEIEPTFIFLENVAAIRLRGLDRVVGELSARGYDCRWKMLSAQAVGAPHVRKRWFLLAAHVDHIERWNQQIIERREIALIAPSDGSSQPVADSHSAWKLSESEARRIAPDGPRDCGSTLANAALTGLEISGRQKEFSSFERPGWWSSEPGICRMVNGCPHRVDRIKALGNGVVPMQARKAFCSLMFGKNYQNNEIKKDPICVN